jgi:hypothetical protein
LEIPVSCANRAETELIWLISRKAIEFLYTHIKLTGSVELAMTFAGTKAQLYGDTT